MDVLELRAPRRFRLPGPIAFLASPAALISLIPLVPVTWALLPAASR